MAIGQETQKGLLIRLIGVLMNVLILQDGISSMLPKERVWTKGIILQATCKDGWGIVMDTIAVYESMKKLARRYHEQGRTSEEMLDRAKWQDHYGLSLEADYIRLIAS